MRARRLTAAAVVLVAALVPVVAGCSGPLTEAAARPSRYVEAPDITSAARQAYGVAAEQAYAELTLFVLEESLVAELMDRERQDVTAEDLNDGIGARFADGSRAIWESTVLTALAGDPAAQGDVKLLRLYDLQVPEGSRLSRADPVQSQVITKGVVDVGPAYTDIGGASATPGPPLRVVFRHSAVIELTGRGGSFDVELDNHLRFELLPRRAITGGITWLIRSYEGELTLATASDELPLADEDATASTTPAG